MINRINFILVTAILRLFRSFKKFYFDYIFFKNVRKVGSNVEISGKINVINNSGLTVGSNVYFGNNIEMVCHAGVIIGNEVTISNDCKIISSYPICRNNYEPSCLSELPLPIIIGDGAYIGKGSVLLSTIDIPPNTVIPPYSTIKSYSDLPNTRLISEQEKIKMNFDFISVQEKYNQLPNEVIFVFSTGRSGSNAIENLANKNNRVNAFHEPFYAQIKTLAFNYCSGFISEEEAKIELMKIYRRAPVTRKDKIYLESDQKLVPFIKIISSLFPKAKFIWLIRSPDSFLKSAKARGWFLNDYPSVWGNQVLLSPEMMSDACRITGDFSGSFTKEEWIKLSQEDKIIWYWKYWNDIIENQLRFVPNDKFLLKLEDINDNVKTFFNFIGDEFNSAWKPEVTNKVKKKHQREYSNLKDDKIQYYNLEILKQYYSNLNQNIFSK